MLGAARDSGVSKSTINRIFRDENYHPYRTVRHQALRQNDYQSRMTFCNWSHGQPHKILFSDECLFKSDFEVNNRNFRYYFDINLYWLKEVDY